MDFGNPVHGLYIFNNFIKFFILLTKNILKIILYPYKGEYRMKNNFKNIFLLSALLLPVASHSNASLLKIVGGDPFVTNISNNYSSNWAGRSNYSSPLTISTTTDNVSLKFEYIFRESFNLSAYLWFDVNPQSFISLSIPNNTVVSSPPTYFDVINTASILPFGFITSLNPFNILFNGDSSKPAAIFPSLRYSFFASFNDPLDSSKSTPVVSGQTGNTIWLAFDDGSPSSLFPFLADRDYDDMIIKITAFTSNTTVDVNEPSTLALLLMSLLGFTFIRVYRENFNYI